MRQTEIRAVFEIILYFALVACITFLIIHFVGQRTVVNGVSMQPTLSDGDNLIVDKLSYRFHDPDRFDIIVFPQEDGRYFIKRIIGLPGENVRIDEDGYQWRKAAGIIWKRSDAGSGTGKRRDTAWSR